MSWAPVPFMDLAAQHAPLEAEIVAIVRGALATGRFAGGPEVAAFEAELAAYTGTAHAVGVASGTDALRLALLAAGVGPGDEVITVPNTFIATTEAISQAGATIRFVDVDPASGALDPRALAAAVGPRTRAVVPVHLFGQVADMTAIAAVADAHGLLVVEDACQAHGARHRGRRAGALGLAAAFSFYPGKNLGACGEAGAVTTDSADLAAAVRRLRDHGQDRKYLHAVEGYNARLDAIQAGILRVKLRRLDAWNQARREHVAAYRQALAGLPVALHAEVAAGDEGAHHLFPILVADRDRVTAAFDAAGIGWGVHYPLPLHLQPAYAGLGLGPGSFPVAEAHAAQLLSLPLFPELTEAQRARVVAVLAAALG